jgi:DHA1 family bicyclomycin/chloramphenicol resistance-like MFS transporter
LSDSRSFPVLLVLITALGPLAMSSFIPAIPAIQQSFGVSTAIAQLTLSISMVAMALSSLVYGAAADRLGRRPVVLAGIALAAVGSILCAWAPTIAWVIVGRILQAAGATAGFVLARVLVRDVYGDARAAAVLGYITAAMALAPLIGPLAGGYLIDIAGWRSIFVAVGVTAGSLFFLSALKLPETQPAVAAGIGAPMHAGGWASLFGRPEYLRYLFFGVFSQAAFFAFIAGSPYLMIEYYGLSASAYGTYFAVIPMAFFSGSLMAGRLAQRWSNARLTGLGALGAAAGSVLAWSLTQDPSAGPWALFLPTSLMSLAMGIGLPGAQAGLLAASGDQPGVGSGLFSFLQLAFSACVAQLIGTIQVFGPAAITATMTVTTSVGLVGFLSYTLRQATPANT